MEMRGRVKNPLPEPWCVAADQTGAKRLADGLGAAGVRAIVVRAADLGAVPPAQEIDEFTLGRDELGWRGGSLPWEDVRVALLWRKEGAPPAEGRGAEAARNSDKAFARLDKFARTMGNMAGMPGFGGGEPDPPMRAPKAVPDDVLEIAGATPLGPVRVRMVKASLKWSGLGKAKQATSQLNWQTLVGLVE